MLSKIMAGFLLIIFTSGCAAAGAGLGAVSAPVSCTKEIIKHSDGPKDLLALLIVPLTPIWGFFKGALAGAAVDANAVTGHKMNETEKEQVMIDVFDPCRYH